MFNKLFGGKQQPPVQPPPQPQQKKFNEMDKNEMKEVQRGFKRKLNTEIREVDRQITKIQMAQKKAEEDLKKEMKKAKPDAFIKKTYAKQVLQCQKQRYQYMQNKAKVQGLSYSLDNFFAEIKLSQTLQATSGVMKEINKCMNIKEMQVSMMEMQKEMEKMGLIQEMMDDALEAVNEDPDYDNQNEIDKLIDNMELNLKNPDKKVDLFAGISQPEIPNVVPNQPQEDDDDDFEKKLQELKS